MFNAHSFKVYVIAKMHIFWYLQQCTMWFIHITSMTYTTIFYTLTQKCRHIQSAYCTWRISHTLRYWLHKLILKANILPSPLNENYRLQWNSSITQPKDYLQYTNSKNINCSALFSKNANVNHFFSDATVKKKIQYTTMNVVWSGALLKWSLLKYNGNGVSSQYEYQLLIWKISYFICRERSHI